ncbi:alpha/beta fold hydrolase [Streptomyces sp. 5K101]|uniref:alpha/beta fold hydrolase n=1 Tax=Streptomyces sp. 5K101 TaxID=3390037 RepID=UPI0039752DD4
MREFVYRGSDDCRLHAAVLGGGPALILLHGGRPDHQSLLPLAHRLADTYTVVLPDVRGYGRSVCVGPARHTWSQYVDDVGALMDHLGLRRAALKGNRGPRRDDHVARGHGISATPARRRCDQRRRH